MDKITLLKQLNTLAAWLIEKYEPEKDCPFWLSGLGWKSRR
jgi:hypothetical protein